MWLQVRHFAEFSHRTQNSVIPLAAANLATNLAVMSHLPAQDPDLARAFARRLSADLKVQGHMQIHFNADAFSMLNGRPSQRLIDPNVNLATRRRNGFCH